MARRSGGAGMTARRPAVTAVKNVSGNEARQCGGARAAALRLAVTVAKNVGGYDPTERDARRDGDEQVTTSPQLTLLHYFPDKI